MSAFLSSCTGDDRSNVDFFFSGQNVVDDLCEDSCNFSKGP